VQNSVCGTAQLLLGLFLAPDRRQRWALLKTAKKTSHFAKGREFFDWLPLSAWQQGFCSMELIIWLISDVTVSVKHRSGVIGTWRKSKLSVWN